MWRAGEGRWIGSRDHTSSLRPRLQMEMVAPTGGLHHHLQRSGAVGLLPECYGPLPTIAECTVFSCYRKALGQLSTQAGKAAVHPVARRI